MNTPTENEMANWTSEEVVRHAETYFYDNPLIMKLCDIAHWRGDMMAEAMMFTADKRVNRGELIEQMAETCDLSFG